MKPVTLRLLSRLGFPIYRRDIWLFLLCVYPALLYVTLKTWDSWHPSVESVLSSASVYSTTHAGDLSAGAEICEYRKWLFDWDLPSGIPRLYPLSCLSVSVVEPLLESSNFALILFAGWGLALTLNVLAFLLPFWWPSYRAHILHRHCRSLDAATHILVHAQGKKAILCPLRQAYKPKFVRNSDSVADGSAEVDAVDSAGRRETRNFRCLEVVRGIQYMRKDFRVIQINQQNFKALTEELTVQAIRKRLLKYRTISNSRSSPLTLKLDSGTTPSCATSSPEDCSTITAVVGDLFLIPPEFDMKKRICDLKVDGLGTFEVSNRLKVFGFNELTIPIPTFIELFGEHAISPIFIFQIFCQILWLLDEYWRYSLMTLGILILFEAQLVHRRRKDLSLIQGMHMNPIVVGVYREECWWRISSSELVPGDLFCLSMNSKLKLKPYPRSTHPIPHENARFSSQDGSVQVPCDALIIHGSCVVNESSLTGESLPLVKNSIDWNQKQQLKQPLDPQGLHKTSMLFAGTSVLLESSDISTAGQRASETNSPNAQASEANPEQTLSEDDAFPGKSGDEAGSDEMVTAGEMGATYYCLRTGFYTTQGKLIRTVLYSSERTSVASRDAMIFLLVLLCVALVASGYVLKTTWGLPNRNHYKLLLHCVMIVTSVVPPDLPITLSMTVTLALSALMKKKLYCTEPFRIPMGGQLSVCCFDKTGTLTASDVTLEGIVSPSGRFNPTPSAADDAPTSASIQSLSDLGLGAPHRAKAPQGSQALCQKSEHNGSTKPLKVSSESPQGLVMGVCNSLVAVPRRKELPLSMRLGTEAQGAAIQRADILGDPMEAAAQKATAWIPLLGQPSQYLTPDKKMTAQIVRRFPFASENQRMTVVIRLTTSAGENCQSAKHDYWVLCKGAPERVWTLLEGKPEWYDNEVERLSFDGFRLLALGSKRLEGLTPEKEQLVTKMPREDLERGLELQGILAFGCRIKPKTEATLCKLRESGHNLVMITGDDPRTASHIAVKSQLTAPHEEIYTIADVKAAEASAPCGSSNGYIVELLSRRRKECRMIFLPGASSTGKGHVRKVPLTQLPAKGTEEGSVGDLRSLAGVALCVTSKDMRLLPWEVVKESLIPYVRIFSRVTPKEKESIISILKEHGEFVLMCGDGTNDVGALKQAHVGVSLLNFDLDKIKENTKAQKDKSLVEDKLLSRERRLQLGLTARQIDTLEKYEENLVKQTLAMSKFSEKMARNALPVLKKQVVAMEERMAQGNLASAAGHHDGAKAGGNLFDEIDDGIPLLKPGDASMASPFTYRGQSIKCVKTLICTGKATLATVMMMYKVMALNSLTSAFGLSVLTLNGVKAGDVQATAESLFLSVLFMSSSNGKASKSMTPERVNCSMLAWPFYGSIIVQAAIHISATCAAWYLAARHSGSGSDGQMDGPFRPTLINTAIFLVSAGQHVSIFVANYEGEPFILGIRKNKILYHGIVLFILSLFVLVLEIIPPLNTALGLVLAPTSAYRMTMFGIVLFEIVALCSIGQYMNNRGRQRRPVNLVTASH